MRIAATPGSIVTESLIAYIETVAAYAPVWGLLIIVVLMAIESSFVPFPSEVVMIPAGFLAARGGLTTGHPVADVSTAVLAGVVGSLAGALINYSLADRLGSPFLARYGKYIFLPPAKLERAEEVFRKYGAGATFVCRLLPAIRQLISIPAGLSKMPIRSFTLWTGLGAGIWVIILAAIGFSIGIHTADLTYADIVHRGIAMLRQNTLWIVASCALVFTVYVWVQNRVMRRSA